MQRFIKLPGSLLFRASINLSHHKSTFAVTVAQRFARAYLARAVVVIPTVVEEVNASIDARTNNANCQLFVNSFQSEMPAAYSYCRHLFSSAAKCSKNHTVATFLSPAFSYERRAIAAQSDSPNPRARAATNRSWTRLAIGIGTLASSAAASSKRLSLKPSGNLKPAGSNLSDAIILP